MINSLNLDAKAISDDRLALLKSKNLILFSGAGISRKPPAYNPISNEVVSVLLDLFCSIAFNDDPGQTKDFFEKVDTKKIRLEIVFDIMKRILGENALDFFSELNCEYPNLDHLYIAKLCSLNHIREIYTLNFDLLHETSLDLLKIRNSRIDTDQKFYDFYNNENKDKNGINIFHLHGSIKNLRELSVSILDVGLSLQKEREKLLRNSLLNNDVFCFGYSDNDPDAFPILAESRNKIFWYIYDIDDISDSLKSLKKQKGDDLIFIYRHFDNRFPGKHKDETSLYDSLNNIFPNLNSYKKQIEKIQIDFNIDTTITIKTKLDYYCQKIRKNISVNPENPINISKYFLGCILFHQNRFEESLNILEGINTSKPDSDLSYYKNQQLAGIYEAMGEAEEARKCWEENYEIFSKDDRFNQYKEFSEVRLASTKIKVWKRNAKEVRCLLDAIDTLLRMTKYENPNIYTIANMGLADLCHHIAEYLPFIFLDVFSRDQNKNDDKILSFEKKISLRKIAFFLFDIIDITGIRKVLLLLSSYLYKVVADDDLSRNYQYKVLCQLRLIELYSAISSEFDDLKLKTLSIANYDISRIRNYYSWANISEGVGNSYLTSAINDYFNRDYKNAEIQLSNAIKYYGDDTSGIIKCKIFSLRIKEKVFCEQHLF